jgi:hypothetical protein
MIWQKLKPTCTIWYSITHSYRIFDHFLRPRVSPGYHEKSVQPAGYSCGIRTDGCASIHRQQIAGATSSFLLIYPARMVSSQRLRVRGRSRE